MLTKQRHPHGLTVNELLLLMRIITVAKRWVPLAWLNNSHITAESMDSMHAKLSTARKFAVAEEQGMLELQKVREYAESIASE